MLELTKTHHIKQIAHIVWHGGVYAVPLKIIAPYKVKSVDNYISVDKLFQDLTQKSGEAGVLLKGLRSREGLSQVQLAKKLKISQANWSAMENGKRTIGKELAKRIASLFKLDYRIFL
jgi:DNA-binding XRE family transcriptional regulator